MIPPPPKRGAARLAAAVAALLVLALFATLPGTAMAERVYLGYGRLLTNDQWGDLRDRYRTGAYTSSRVWGPAWTGRLPTRPGALLELRFHGETMTPAALRFPAPGDRPYAGALSFGMHTHYRQGAAEISLGGDVVVTGPQTRLSDLQGALHEVLDAAKPSDRVLANQIPDGTHPTLVVEVGRALSAGRTRLRPFVEARTGAESLLRVGADLTIGSFGEGELLVREVSTGHRYRVIAARQRGVSFVAGADVARVFDSVFLPADRGYRLTDRARVRAGLHWQGRRNALFYGLTWLGPEFEAQPEGQLVGALRLDLRF
ncbi:lipid A-modifier LpxR family protein [Rhodosalinus sp.]|uniref:lipid A-modifier LpxR family protein n=1 Tax=Rhodosalinus sp. TaxID=2047741 RepID=UPI00397AE617